MAAAAAEGKEDLQRDEDSTLGSMTLQNREFPITSLIVKGVNMAINHQAQNRYIITMETKTEFAVCC